jgi:hypothetical protein
MAGPIMNIVGLIGTVSCIIALTENKLPIGYLIFSIAMLFFPIIVIFISGKQKQMNEVRRYVFEENTLLMSTDSIQIRKNLKDVKKIYEGKTIYFITFTDKIIIFIPKRLISTTNKDLINNIKKTKGQRNPMKVVSLSFIILMLILIIVGFITYLTE